MPRNDWLTVQEAAELTERTTRAIRYWLADEGNKIQTWRPGRTVLINRLDLLRVEKAKTAAIARSTSRQCSE